GVATGVDGREQGDEPGDHARAEEDRSPPGVAEPRADVVGTAQPATTPCQRVGRGERDDAAEDRGLPGPIAEPQMTGQWCASSGRSRYSVLAPRAHTASDTASHTTPTTHIHGPTPLRTSLRNPTKVTASAMAALIGARLGGGRCGVLCASPASRSAVSRCSLAASSLIGHASLDHPEVDARPGERGADQRKGEDERRDPEAHVLARQLPIHHTALMTLSAPTRLGPTP